MSDRKDQDGREYVIKGYQPKSTEPSKPSGSGGNQPAADQGQGASPASNPSPPSEE